MYYDCQYLVGVNVAGAPASTEIEMNKTIYRLVGDGMAPIYDSILPDTHRCQVEERRAFKGRHLHKLLIVRTT